jgi:CheY-like chemotaxis protein
MSEQKEPHSKIKGSRSRQINSPALHLVRITFGAHTGSGFTGLRFNTDCASSANARPARMGFGMEMPRYFCDLDNGKSRYVDLIGTELSNVSMVPGDAIGFLASVFKDASPRTNDSIHVVRVRNEAGVTIFTTSLTLQSEWLDARHGTTAKKRSVVLVVEDDILSRMDAAIMIVGAGCDVVEAGDADEAIAILEARSDIEVIFTDVQMPGSMDGWKLARYVSGRWPPIKIIATSGYFAVREGDLPQGGVFLSKPYSPGAVTRALLDLNVSAVWTAATRASHATH